MSVTFICEKWPAYGVGVPAGWKFFQHGELTLEKEEDITALRANRYYGTRIFELEPEIPDPMLVDATDREAPVSAPEVSLPESVVRLDGTKILCPECGPDVSPNFGSPDALETHRQRLHGVFPSQERIAARRTKPRKRRMVTRAANLSTMR